MAGIMTFGSIPRDALKNSNLFSVIPLQLLAALRNCLHLGLYWKTLDGVVQYVLRQRHGSPSQDTAIYRICLPGTSSKNSPGKRKGRVSSGALRWGFGAREHARPRESGTRKVPESQKGTVIENVVNLKRVSRTSW